MGLRPQMCLVFGIENYPATLIYEDLEIPIDIPKEDKRYLAGIDTDLDLVGHIYWGGFNENSNNILGVVLNRTQNDSDFVRALSIFHPEYEESGYKKILPWSKETHALYVNQIENRWPVCKDIKFQWSWFYPSIIETHSYWPTHAFTTRFLLNLAGAEIDYKQFELFLVWDWT